MGVHNKNFARGSRKFLNGGAAPARSLVFITVALMGSLPLPLPHHHYDEDTAPISRPNLAPDLNDQAGPTGPLTPPRPGQAGNATLGNPTLEPDTLGIKSDAGSSRAPPDQGADDGAAASTPPAQESVSGQPSLSAP